METRALAQFVARAWQDSILPALTDYIRIPAKSPAFDADWAAHGELERAVELAAAWCRERRVAGLAVDIVRLPGRTPTLVVEAPASGAPAPAGTVLLYGHLDKQPEVTGWDANKGPWTPVVEDGRLYGRGSADDGYACFASLTAIEALQAQGAPHARCVMLIETSEESGSPDLSAYVDHLAPRIGEPDLVICLDSGAGDYERIWLCTSLRGNVTGDLSVETVREGVHSGDASGVVPSSFRVIRELLDRIEDSRTGRVLLRELDAAVPAHRQREAAEAAVVLGDEVHTKYPFQPGVRPMGRDGADRILARTWRPSLSITGAAGLPSLADAGNVLRPLTALKLSFRLAPTTTPEVALAAIEQALTAAPPSGAKVTWANAKAATGWDAPAYEPWLAAAIQDASLEFFDRPAVGLGEGGTIPLMGLLAQKFPKAQFVITGVLGPGSNAHGPNEFLHLQMAERLTAATAFILGRHAVSR
ncbi:MAG: M20/M25/M40 family metallo-hydrolase [Planctomycetota bacterium]